MYALSYILFSIYPYCLFVVVIIIIRIIILTPFIQCCIFSRIASWNISVGRWLSFSLFLIVVLISFSSIITAASQSPDDGWTIGRIIQIMMKMFGIVFPIRFSSVTTAASESQDDGWTIGRMTTGYHFPSSKLLFLLASAVYLQLHQNLQTTAELFDVSSFSTPLVESLLHFSSVTEEPRCGWIKVDECWMIYVFTYWITKRKIIYYYFSWL